MNQPYIKEEEMLQSVFSDGTELFRTPAEPESGDRVTVRLRVRRDAGAKVFLLRGFPAVQKRMSKVKTDDCFDWYRAVIRCGDGTILYSFLIEWQGRYIHFDRMGARWADCAPSLDPTRAFRIIPGFHVPSWSRGAVQYQILPDRFRKGNRNNDVQDREYWYARAYIRRATCWEAPPEQDDYHCHYGGDLQGVLEKLDYLQSLGVEAIYFNPIFVSPSPHGYDTQDYDHVDPHLTVIPVDSGDVLEDRDTDNAHATLYRTRTTHPDNLKASDAWFEAFCAEVHRRGMKLILDGVFNHCGSFGRWMNREGVYAGEEGAFGHPQSPYRGWFSFKDDWDYHCWWDIETLPKLYYERSAALCEEIFRVAEKWAGPPYSIDGWRLDVAADLGLSPEFNHLFWKEFRRRVKAVNPELIIIAEHYGDPSPWLGGDEWDTVMNYDAFMDPLSFFLTGMEKHSDYRRDDLYQNGTAFFQAIFEAMSRMPTPSIYSAMDELSNHDHSRFMTRTNGRVGRLNTVGGEAAGWDIHPEVFREAAVIQMTWPGAPTIYYGDEAGLVGWTDPDNRRTYPWEHEDREMIEFFRALARLRESLPVLRYGSIKPLCAGWGYIAYARFDAQTAAIVTCNNTDQTIAIDLSLRGVGIPDGAAIRTRFNTTEQGFITTDVPAGTAESGVLRFDAPAHSAFVLTYDLR